MSAALSFEPDEPQGSGLPGEPGGDGWDGEEGIRQGLYVTLPAEELTLEGFAAGGRADTMAPGPLLAVVLGAVAGEDGEGLPGLSDDQLIGFLSGTRRMESRLAWAKMAALAEFASRPRRLPGTFAALGAGKLHPVHVKIIEEVTSILSDQDAAAADEELAAAAPSKTYGELRAAASRLVLKLDSDAARRRKEMARGAARVRGDGTGSAAEPAPGPAAGARPGVRAMITITVPHTALDGDAGPPGEVAGFGIVDHADTRDLIAAAAANPATRWCVTVLNPDGTAAAHGCAAGPRRWPPPPGPPGPMTLRGLLEFLNIKKLNHLIHGPCPHARAEPGYRPGRQLQHLIRTRTATCAAPGCGRRAASCDLDHTEPRHHGGRTCECNLAPSCQR